MKKTTFQLSSGSRRWKNNSDDDEEICDIESKPNPFSKRAQYRGKRKKPAASSAAATKGLATKKPKKKPEPSIAEKLEEEAKKSLWEQHGKYKQQADTNQLKADLFAKVSWRVPSSLLPSELFPFDVCRSLLSPFSPIVLFVCALAVPTPSQDCEIIEATFGALNDAYEKVEAEQAANQAAKQAANQASKQIKLLRRGEATEEGGAKEQEEEEEQRAGDKGHQQALADVDLCGDEED